jgi:hypothetical protein
MKKIDAIVLKALLLMEDEEDAGKLDTAPEKDVNAKPGSFEADPMEFILKKYVTLNSLLEELMTPSFRDYVDAIFIVAPKPTTFKVLLHNGQYFFLTFLGKAYEATINGRNYYLVQIGEKERCMIAISKLLRFGSPLKTKGPEGSEQGTRDEEGGESEDLGLAAASETPEETPAEPESLEESIKILTNMLLLEVAKVKKIYSKDPFMLALISAISGSSASGGKHYEGKKDSGKGGGNYFIKGNFGQAEETEAVIASAMSYMNFKPSNYTVEYIDPKDFKLGARSGTYTTYEITIKSVNQRGKNPTPPEINVGDVAYLCSAVRQVSASSGQIAPTLVGKALTPKGLGVQGNYTKASSAITAVEKAIKERQPDIYPLLHSLLNDVITSPKSLDSDLAEIKTKDIMVELKPPTIAELQKVSQSDINTVGKDFGEILGGIYLALGVGIAPDRNLSWPSGNFELIDFFLNGFGISSKYKKGAAASITGLVKKYAKDKIPTSEAEAKFLNTMSSFTDPELTSPDAFLRVARLEANNMKAINTLASIIGVNVEDVSRQSINDYIEELVGSTKSDKQKTLLFKQKFDPLFKQLKHAPSGYNTTDDSKGVIEWSSYLPSQYYGIITSGFSYYVCDRLNEVPAYLELLKAMASKTEVKQMYLDVFIKQSKMTFSIKSFNDPDAKFKFHIPSIAATNPTSSKLGFKLQ